MLNVLSLAVGLPGSGLGLGPGSQPSTEEGCGCRSRAQNQHSESNRQRWKSGKDLGRKAAATRLLPGTPTRAWPNTQGRRRQQRAGESVSAGTTVGPWDVVSAWGGAERQAGHSKTGVPTPGMELRVTKMEGRPEADVRATV